MNDQERQFRLRRFWGSAIFSLGVLWGAFNIVYSPIAALTSIAGSSWPEVVIVLAGGLLTFIASTAAFFRRRLASLVFLVGGVLLLLLAIWAQWLSHEIAAGLPNLLLLFLAGTAAIALGAFGILTERMGWPPLR